MLDILWPLEFAFFQILSGIFIIPNLILSVDYVDIPCPLIALVQILSGVYMFSNLILSAVYDNIRWPLEFSLFQILILSSDYGDSRWL